MTTNQHKTFVEVQMEAIEAIKTCYDPEIPVDIYELGLIYEIKVSIDLNVHVIMTLTSAFCPAAQTLPAEVQRKVEAIEEVKNVTVEVTFDPPWTQDMMSEAAKLELGFL
ncbi:iron-sulfur cluster assembly protein [Solitalea lacus]|uniref:iron-sulfur cluster assembly protein n=1 Tax=Solitalea lacus TaxID=2911172 RepID=UPI001EDC1BC4|nr:iron-sulfur cluster assembly protein [Solitalea lacus]UKJ09256.1 iron-sulfur cluster assembly protein [Solitalea lacus]